MFEDLNSKIESFYQMNETESDSFLKELNKRANRDTKQFKQYMEGIGYGYESNRPIFYESLTKLNPNKWSDYLFQELKQLIQKAEDGDKNATYELSSIHWLTDIPNMNNDFYYQTKMYLFTKLKSKIAQIRELSLTAIFDILNHLNEKPNESEKIDLIKCLNDSNFKNKVYAYSDLKEANLVPKDFKFSTIENIKIKLKGYTKLVE